MTPTKPPIIIDTDPGADDFLAILLLYQSSLFDIKAVTTVAGNSDIQHISNNAQYTLDLIGASTPIYTGAHQPLTRSLVQANVHGSSGLAGATITKNVTLTDNAPEKIVEFVRQNPHQISIVAIGPLTNIATAFTQNPDLPALVKNLIIMGGAISVPGNKNRVAEFNFFVDPDAADIVFRSSVEKILIPLDICNEIPLFLSDFESLQGSPLYSPIIQIMRHYIKGILKFENVKGALVYDPLAAYYLINPAAYQLTPMDIVIETKGEHTFGMSVADKTTWGHKNFNTQVVTSVNRNSFVQDFLSFLKK